MTTSTITKARLSSAVSTLSRPIADSTHTIDRIAFLVLELTTAGGTVGESYLLSFNYSPRGIRGSIEDLLAGMEGTEVWQTGLFSRQAAIEAEYFGFTGLQKQAAALINVAMWDAWARTLATPIWKLFGVTHTQVPVYGSGGWLSYSSDELIAEVKDYKRRGFSAVKIKVGSPEPAEDIRRVALVREAVGNDIKIMIDANQGCDLPGALGLAEALKPYGIHWFEEPLNHSDFRGFKTLRDKSGISLAMGEREYNTTALRELISLNAIDLWQPDLIRIGGVEAWRESAALAEGFHIPVLPHYYKDYDVPLLCGVQRPYGAESFDWIDPIIDSKMRIENGFAYPREEPGWGFRFKREHLTELVSLEF